MSLPERRLIGIQVAAQMAGQQERLGVGKHAPWALFIEIRMQQFLTLAFLPSLNILPLPNIGQSHCAAGRAFEAFALNL